MQGVRTDVTDVDGNYRFAILPPGVYEVRFIAGRLRRRDAQRRARLARQGCTVDVVLRPATVSEAITVVGQPRRCSTRPRRRSARTSTRGHRDAADRPQLLVDRAGRAGRLLGREPAQRLAEHDHRVRLLGAENAFFIDGVNTTSMEYGFQGKELNFEFIQEVDVKTGGYEAEYGRSTGGIINVITKSGGNEFHGDVFGYFDSDSLQSDAEPIVSTGGTVESASRAGLRRRPRRLSSSGQALVLRRLRPRRATPTDNAAAAGPHAGRSSPAESERDLGVREADLQARRRTRRWSSRSSRIRATTPARSTTPTTR